MGYQPIAPPALVRRGLKVENYAGHGDTVVLLPGQPRDASELLNRLLRHETSRGEFFSEDDELKVLRELLKDRGGEISRTFGEDQSELLGI